MHILITGATGFIGKHVLFEALLDNRITKVTVVGRHPPSLDEKLMDSAKSAIIQKLTIITREDLSVWDYERDSELVSALADCRACIWYAQVPFQRLPPKGVFSYELCQG